MARRCDICGKGPIAGRNIARRGRAKRLQGAGRKITGVTKRTFRPNLQRIQAIVDGSPSRVKVCCQCLRSGKVTKAG